jgi:ABC-type nitrate/sulfonate/bicarbonate transport system substrate-binding protein
LLWGARMRKWFLLAFCAAILAVVLIIRGLQPPAKMTMASGPAGGAYARIAAQYQKILAQDGIDLKLVETSGSVENADLISTQQVDTAILQGGIRVADPDVETIGGLFFEPMIFLVRKDSNIPRNPALWHRLRINSGPPGSGTAAAFADFETAVGLQPSVNQHLGLKYSQAVKALVEGQIDIAVFVAPVNAPYLAAAYSDPAVRFLPLEYTEAISRRLEYATTVTMPPGAVSLLPVIPQGPRLLMVLEARLAITPDLHPALVNRLTMAAIELHSARGAITDHGMFPSVEGTGLPVNNASRQLIISGPSIWQDWLPYWMASQVHRLVLLLLPILFIALPALRALPQIYAYAMRWRVWKHYPEIRVIEDRLTNTADQAELAQMDVRLVDLDESLSQIRIPASYKQTAYDARLHIELVRNRIGELQAGLRQG